MSNEKAITFVATPDHQAKQRAVDTRVKAAVKAIGTDGNRYRSALLSYAWANEAASVDELVAFASTQEPAPEQAPSTPNPSQSLVGSTVKAFMTSCPAKGEERTAINARAVQLAWEIVNRKEELTLESLDMAMGSFLPVLISFF